MKSPNSPWASTRSSRQLPSVLSSLPLTFGTARLVLAIRILHAAKWSRWQTLGSGRFCFGAPLPSILRVLTTETSPALGASHRHYMGYLDLHSALLRSTLSVWAFVLAVALPLDRELVRFYVVLRLP
jgi:hypothetical protein